MSSERPGTVETQCATAVLMVRPARFGFNPQTAASNRFAHDRAGGPVAQRALNEFDTLARSLAAAGVRVCVTDDTAEPAKPDAVFPNNWVSFHRDGTIVLYPMQAASRRQERRLEMLERVQQQLGFRCSHLLDLSVEEAQGRFLEGTGSLVLDHIGRVAYACPSPRTDASLAREWAAAMRYDLELFDAFGSDGTPVYHTNVLLAIGAGFAVLCSPAISPRDRDRVRSRLLGSGRRLVEIGIDAMQHFAGNVLELRTAGAAGAAGNAPTVLVMSERAGAAIDDSQRELLQSSVGRLLAVSLPTIETIGGGGARCMLAEVPELEVPEVGM